MITIIISLMVIVTTIIIRFFQLVKKFANENQFFVIGKWKPGMAGLIIAILISVIFAFNGLFPLLPILLFLTSLFFIYINMSPVLLIKKNKAAYFTLNNHFSFDLDEITVIGADAHNLALVINNEIALSIPKDSTNMNLLMTRLLE